MKRGGPLKRRAPLWKTYQDKLRRGHKVRRSSLRRRSERQDTLEGLHSLVKRKVCILSATFSPQYGFKRYRPAPAYHPAGVVDLGTVPASGPCGSLLLPTCCRCGRRMPALYLDLDEIEGRHTGGLIPGVVDPGNVQPLCRGCHEIKPTENGGHVDYCETHQPDLKARLLLFRAEILRNLGPYPGTMKPSLPALSAAIREACRKVYQ